MGVGGGVEVGPGVAVVVAVSVTVAGGSGWPPHASPIMVNKVVNAMVMHSLKSLPLSAKDILVS